MINLPSQMLLDKADSNVLPSNLQNEGVRSLVGNAVPNPESTYRSVRCLGKRLHLVRRLLLCTSTRVAFALTNGAANSSASVSRDGALEAIR